MKSWENEKNEKLGKSKMKSWENEKMKGWENEKNENSKLLFVTFAQS